MIPTANSDVAQLYAEILALSEPLQFEIKPTIKLYRSYLSRANDALKQHFIEQRYPIEALVCGQAKVVDQLFIHLWHHVSQPLQQPFSLIAVGGYGRGELHPHSDIDILLLHQQPLTEAESATMEQLITLLWDIGLDIGHSVRTLEECRHQAASDVTVMTNLIEARYLCGDKSVLQQLKQSISPDLLWSCPDYFSAKMEEQRRRHKHYNDTAYNLEPNIKEGPGGLRDIQMVGWVAKRHFGADKLSDLVAHQFLTAEEYQHLLSAKGSYGRFAMHSISSPSAAKIGCCSTTSAP